MTNREQEAKLLLENPVFVEAFSKLEEELLDLWKMSGSTDIDQRESFWLAVRLLDRIRVHRRATPTYLEEIYYGGYARCPVYSW